MQTPRSKNRIQRFKPEQGRVSDVLESLRSLSNPEAVSSMARFGIRADKAFGVSVPALRKLARSIGRDHALAQELWDTGLHEARELATMIADPKQTPWNDG